MEYKPDKLIEDLLKNKRIQDKVNEFKLTKKQILSALPILIDMNSQIDDKSSKFLTSFYLTDEGEVKRIEEKSTYWKRFEYLDNVKTFDIEKVDFDDEKEVIKEAARAPIISRTKKYLDLETYQKGMYICGDMGIGKTFLLKRIARRLAIEGYEVGFISVPNLVINIKSKFGTTESYEGTIKKLKEIDYLFLDDIGAETVSGWFRDDILFSILNERMQNQKTTFFSSNYSMNKLQKIESRTYNSKYPDLDKSSRLITRIKTLADEIILKGTSKR